MLRSFYYLTAFGVIDCKSTSNCPFTRELKEKDSEPPPGVVRCSLPFRLIPCGQSGVLAFFDGRDSD